MKTSAMRVFSKARYLGAMLLMACATIAGSQIITQVFPYSNIPLFLVSLLVH